MSGKNKTYYHKRLRRQFAASLPLPCCRCGVTIQLGERFHLDHYPVAEIDGGTEIHVSHPKCNTSAGNALGRERARQHRALELEALRACGFYAELPSTDPMIGAWQRPAPAEPSRVW